MMKTVDQRCVYVSNYILSNFYTIQKTNEHESTVQRMDKQEKARKYYLYTIYMK